ncbi:hypothetical protein WJ968_34640 [Achromobacter xylosoxidans]
MASIIGKCHFCVQSHYENLKNDGLSTEQLRDAVPHRRRGERRRAGADRSGQVSRSARRHALAGARAAAKKKPACIVLAGFCCACADAARRRRRITGSWAAWSRWSAGRRPPRSRRRRDTSRRSSPACRRAAPRCRTSGHSCPRPGTRWAGRACRRSFSSARHPDRLAGRPSRCRPNRRRAANSRWARCPSSHWCRRG